jgi:hypothetical protein
VYDSQQYTAFVSVSRRFESVLFPLFDVHSLINNRERDVMSAPHPEAAGIVAAGV